ncbi:MAG TPA: tRNA (N(6)-L-threonylcarbamoyladenosine(37)-C(2))-methylthiotransferase MtaB [Candidatus Eisenbacteria bacterium]|nr:tRNA (N(6)-L-threonylcarbamoyladenosine(37)-C(2))-methylthiotransferase MtaB [Candidatus Eisenbacteria bacterium]
MPYEIPPGASATAPRVFYFTLGCRLNQHDTAAMRAALGGAGWAEAREGEAADVVVVNTCTVTGRADQEARQAIRRLAREHPGARVVVTGCYAQRAPLEVAAIPGVSQVLGTAERDTIAERLGAPGAVVLRDPNITAPARRDVAAIAVGPARAKGPPAPAGDAPPIPVAFGRTRALLKVQDGCDAFCSYCVVPYVRGRSRSLPLAEATARARRLLDAGFHEIVLTGADLGAYGRDLGRRGLLAALVESILSLGPSHRVRISSIEPNKVDPALAALAGSEPRLCRHFHLPLQSGSPAVLRAMRRPYGPEAYARLVERLAGGGPAAIGADVIVGHPGEGEAEFEETCRFVSRLPITHLHVFRYSPRPGTRAALQSGAAPLAVARERSERLRVLANAKREAFHRSLIGSVRPAIAERAHPSEQACIAMTDVYAPVRLERRPAAGGILSVRIEALRNGALAGAAIG